MAPLTAALLIVSSVAVPLLDSGPADPGAVLESEHHAASCLQGHDHTICAQAGANLFLEVEGTEATASGDLVPLRLPELSLLAQPGLGSFANHSRAPPPIRV